MLVNFDLSARKPDRARRDGWVVCALKADFYTLFQKSVDHALLCISVT